MVEGEQYLGCLKHIDSLMEQDPGHDRACLLATKCLLLRMTDQFEAARATADLYLQKYPDNQIALAEKAIQSVEGDARTALSLLVRALRAGNGSLASRTYQAMGLVAAVLLHDGFPMPARAILQLQCDLAERDPRPQQVLAALSQAADVPLLLRDDSVILPCPENAAWNDRFNDALQAVAIGDWQTGADRFTAMVADLPGEAVLWQNLATLRGWLADNAGCAEALRRFSAIRAAEPDGLDDAVEAEAKAMFLSEYPLGDPIGILKLVWTVNDADKTQEALLSSSRFRGIPFDPAQFNDGETPPPKGAYMLLDRPMPENADGLNLENVPKLLGQALLFGRQTDREARLEVMAVAADDLQAVKDMILAATGDSIHPEPSEEVVAHWSAGQRLLRTGWQPPRGTTPEQLQAMMDQHRQQAIFERWPDLKLGVLDGRTLRDAAKDGAYRIRSLAAILVMEYWSGQLPGEVDFNALRSQLGLPVQEPIDTKKTPVAELPTVRLARLNPESLSDQDLLLAYYRSVAFAIRPVLRKTAKAVVERPSLANSNERLHAYATLVRNEENVGRALEYVDEGRKAGTAKNESCATWDLMELSLRFAAHDGPRSMQLIQHLHDRHMEEPGVGEALTRMLVEVGLLRPDGTPAFGPEASAAMAPEAPAAEPGGIWTPDAGQPSSGGGGKLWTPD
jgi:hypothetical protein